MRKRTAVGLMAIVFGAGVFVGVGLDGRSERSEAAVQYAAGRDEGR